MADALIAMRREQIGSVNGCTVERVVLENSRMEALKEKVVFSFWEKKDDTHTVVRFATSWATTAEDVAALRDVL